MSKKEDPKLQELNESLQRWIKLRSNSFPQQVSSKGIKATLVQYDVPTLSITGLTYLKNYKVELIKDNEYFIRNDDGIIKSFPKELFRIVNWTQEK